jgi:predicted RNA-binding protein associated with RNAse of E/G family
MKKPTFFSPGQTAITRTVWQGKIWAAGPYRIIQDTPDLLAMYIAPGAPWRNPRTLDGGRPSPRNRATSQFKVVEAIWQDFTMLRLKIPGSDYSVELYFNADLSFRAWYINMETPFRRFALGFDYEDEELDIIIEPDLSTWHWKDEDDLKEAVEFGFISKERAAFLYKEGERVTKWIQSGNSPFNGWEKWRPDPAWQMPVLPDDWDKI